ncbi:MAG TPA: hypothetical protein VME67_15075 [Mycobacterium sp.]|nr:hypothetical protein [Mycobacterium sp.]HTX96062.1 hypothetical protein [Mycobacterium sp.]
MPDESADTETDLDVLDVQTPASEEAQEDGADTFTVTNPPGTVSVSALLDGSTDHVELSPKVTGMTEDELAEEILVIARLARHQGAGCLAELLAGRGFPVGHHA